MASRRFRRRELAQAGPARAIHAVRVHARWRLAVRRVRGEPNPAARRVCDRRIDGSKYAVLASPRPPDALTDVHEVIEPDQASLYVVNADGTGGSWWCPALK